MLFPPKLNRGDYVAVVAPSGIVSKQVLDNAKALLAGWGLKVIVAPHADGSYHFFSGTKEERLSDINKAISDNNIKAIFCARGGYGSIHLVEEINWHILHKHPKWVIGFSDITVLHSKLLEIGVASIHGPMPKTFPQVGEKSKDVESLKALLMDDFSTVKAEAHYLNIKGTAKGVLFGGNLSILYSLLGTPLKFKPEGKILFIEDLCEQYYHLDRMLNSFKLSGVFSKISGLIVGQFTDMKDSMPSYGKNTREIVSNIISSYKIPVAYNFPVGHGDVNCPLVLGANVELTVADNVEIRYL